MTQTIRVSLPGFNAGTDTNIDHYSVYSDSDNILIKEKTRGTVNVANGATGTVAHGLGYIPFVSVVHRIPFVFSLSMIFKLNSCT